MLPPVQLADVEPVRTGISVIRQHRRRTQVQVPIQVGRNGLCGAEPVWPKNGAAVAIRINLLQLADPTAAHEFACLAELATVLAALLRAGLVNAPVTANRSQHRLAFSNRHRGRFFAINVLSRLSGHRGHRGVPMRGRCDQHRIDVRSRQHLPEIRIGLAGAVIALTVSARVILVHFLGRGLAATPPDIANREHLHILAPGVTASHIGPSPAEQVTAALPTHTNEAHRNSLTGRYGPLQSQSRCGYDEWRRSGGPDHSRRLAQKSAPGKNVCRFHNHFKAVTRLKRRRAPGFRSPQPYQMLPQEIPGSGNTRASPFLLLPIVAEAS